MVNILLTEQSKKTWQWHVNICYVYHGSSTALCIAAMVKGVGKQAPSRSVKKVRRKTKKGMNDTRTRTNHSASSDITA